MATMEETVKHLELENTKLRSENTKLKEQLQASQVESEEKNIKLKALRNMMSLASGRLRKGHSARTILETASL